ncbi:MAG TPA: helix-turn-helix transcriptional regulator [Paraburkholderia sp.]|nr:helix-turn-helix transcriptional regulator [Paraburkholderia sp.]
MTWQPIDAPPGEAPRPMTMRVQVIPPRCYYPEHCHQWYQMIYATDGALTVAAQEKSFVTSPKECVWLPPRIPHRVGSLYGAQFRSLWFAEDAGFDVPQNLTVFGITPLLKELIVEAAAVVSQPVHEGYADRVTGLIVDQFRRMKSITRSLPWPSGGSRLSTLCETLYANPADSCGLKTWGDRLGMSERSLARHFELEVGVTFRTWRRLLRLHKALEMLSSGMDVTQTALELGYGSTSAFVFAFRTEMGYSPGHMR